MTDQNNCLYEELGDRAIKVSATSRPNAVGGAIAIVMRERNYAELQAIGANAINQAMKSIIVARAYLVDEMDIVIAPRFVKVDIDGNERDAMRMEVIRR